MLRRSLASLLICFSLAADAQHQPIVKAPVNVAWELYKGCVFGTLKSSRPERNNVLKFVSELDDYCLHWTVIWYSTQKDPIAHWSADKHFRFNERREALMNILRGELLITSAR